MHNTTLKFLDISHNAGKDKLCSFIMDFYQSSNTETALEIIDISQNGVSEAGNQFLLYMFRHHSHIVIRNDWADICNDLAIRVINSYYSLSKRYRIVSEIVPKYLKSVILRHCNLDDQFAICFANYYHCFNFLEEVDLRENPMISQIGKKHMLIHLLDRRTDLRHLNYFYVDDEIHSTIADRGIFHYWMYKLQNATQNRLPRLHHFASYFILKNNLSQQVFEYNLTLVRFLVIPHSFLTLARRTPLAVDGLLPARRSLECGRALAVRH